MPNTLCHIGIQAPFNRLLLQKIDLLPVVLACIIPDIPWILQRIILKLGIIDPYDLQLFCIGQASLFFCLVLSAALALISVRPGSFFVILSGNCLVHLLLDATQIKWANGVHLLSPVSWSMQHFDALWPEHPIWQIMTVFGFSYLAFHWGSLVKRKERIFMIPNRRRYPALCLFLIYLVGPLLFMPQIEQANNAYISTLRETPGRNGKYIELDRVYYSREQQTIKTGSGEQLTLSGKEPGKSGLISIKGRFLSEDTIEAETIHSHSGFRDYASYLGLFMACALFLQSVIMSRKKITNS